MACWVRLCGLALPCALLGATLTVPQAHGPLVIDGVLTEREWSSAALTTLRAAGFGAPFPDGGEARIAVRGRYLLVAARLPENGRVVALSTGRNPGFTREDTIAWKFYTYAAGAWRTTLILTANPLGGFRFDYTSPVGAQPPLRRPVHEVGLPEDWRSYDPLVYLVPMAPSTSGEAAMAAARIERGEWTVEGAIPLAAFSDQLGYMEVERIRVRRHDAPELSWHWPARNVRGEFQIGAHDANLPAPLFRPAALGDAPQIGVPKFAALPPPEAAWDGPEWRRAARIELTRDEPEPRKPGFPAEIRFAHDGRTLTILARAVEPEPLRASASGHDSGIAADDHIEVFLSTGGAYVRIAANPNGAIADSMGNVAGGPLWPTDSWDSRASARGAREPGAWTLRLNIPLAEVAHALDEPGVPDRLRILIRRIRPARTSSRGETAVWPATGSVSPFTPARYAHLNLLSPGTAAAPGTPKRVPNGLAGQIAALPSHVWSDEQRKTTRPDQMLEKSLRARMASAAAEERLAWEQVRTLEDWQRFRERRFGAFERWIGPFPERTPLRAEVTRRADYGDGFVIENIVFESRPGLLVTGNLFLPQRIEGRIPAILLAHCHHAAKTQAELQDMGMNWARAGAAVLVIDQAGAGERVQSNPWPREGYYSRYTLHMQLGLAGESLMKWMVWDLMRAIDLLLERPYVDPRRIVLIGSVAGGGDPAAVTAALDARVAAVAPFNFGEAGPEEHYNRGPRGYDFDTAWPGWGSWEITRNMPRSVAGQFFPWFVCASVAPRGFIYSFEMGWPKGVEGQPAWARYQKVFSLYQQPDRLGEVHGFGPFPGAGERPNVGVEHRHMLYPILNRWLGVPVPADEYHNPRPQDDLTCLTPAVAAARRPKPVSALALELARMRLQAARSQREGTGSEERAARLRTELQTRLGDIAPNRVAPAAVLSARDYGAFTLERLAIDAEPGIVLPVVLLKPKAAGNRIPVVLGFAQGGKERFLSDRSAVLARLLQAGVAVCLPDLRGTGETGGESRTPGSMTLATVELMLGDTMLGAQLKDARTVFAYLVRRPDLDAGRIALWGDSFAGTNPRDLVIDESPGLQAGPQIQRQGEPLGTMIALLTALYEESAVAAAVNGALASYASALEDRFCYLPLDALVPGLLETGDISDIAAAIAPRGLLLQNVVDGRNRPLNPEEVESALGAARGGYRRETVRLILKSEARTDDMAVWLIQQCRP